MISVVVYGRNDSYGYNLHKRGVLSLNCIAELLDDPDDEIIFADYNTPDDLPTFTEAIWDMLTPRARRLVRTLRIRPSLHGGFASRTHLRCVEAPARNAAIRRSNPNNRWLLATNTDMIFVTRDGRSLSAIASDLPDGFYHTARFELPEILWETLDRGDPNASVESVARWGKRFQLNEVVYGAPETLFDGPGDFQLFLRNDAFSIGGFDERMLLGWHCDTNLAKRLSLLRGESVNSLLDYVLAYHCDHNRESTPMHAHGATQNSWDRFVTSVRQSDVPGQSDSWGFAGESLEEIRLGDQSKVLAALESVIPSMGDELYVTGITPNLTDLRYDPEHVVPYITNAISALPRAWNVGYAGCRQKALELFAALWDALGFTGKVLIAPESPARTAGAESSGCLELVDAENFRARADFFVFEMGASNDDRLTQPTGARKTPEEKSEPLGADDYARTLRVHRAYVQAVAHEAERAGLPRRFILVNMQNNWMKRTAAWRIGTSATPIGTRVTHGFALGDPFVRPLPEAATWLQSRLAGVWPAGRDDLETILTAVRCGKVTAEIELLGPVASDLVRVLQSDEGPAALDVGRRHLQAFVAAFEARRSSNRIRDARSVDVIDSIPAERGVSRVAALEDFDDPEWGQWAIRTWGVAPINNKFFRVRPIWETTHAVFALERCGVLGGKLLLLAHTCDGPPITQPLANVLSDWSGNCTVADINGELPASASYDAVVVSAPALLVAGVELVAAVSKLVDRVLRPGGVAVFVVDLVLDGPAKDAVDVHRLRKGLFNLDSHPAAVWHLVPPFGTAFTARTLDTLSAPNPHESLIRLDEEGRLRGSCVVVYRKQTVAAIATEAPHAHAGVS